MEVLEKPITETEKKTKFNLQSLKQCAFTSGDDVCHNRGGVENPFCHWHTPKINYIQSDPEKLSVIRSIQIINQVVNETTKPSDISDRDLKAIPVIMNIINSGSNIALKEASLIDAQTKLNNAIKIIAGILQEEIKSAPLFERIINKITSVDLNETQSSIKKKIKSVIVSPVVVAPVVAPIIEPEANAPETPIKENSINSDIQLKTDESIQPIV